MSNEPGKVDDGLAGVFGRGAATYARSSHFAHFGNRLVEHAQIGVGASVLDVATGRGALAFPAAKRVGLSGRVIGTDIATGMLNETAKDVHSGNWHNIELRQMDAEQIQYPDGTFDYVLCGFALWFFPQPHRALQEFCRVLKPGGRLALTTWGHDSPMHNLQRDAVRGHLIPTANADDTQKKPRFDTEDQLEAALRQSGFVDSKVFSEDFKAIFGEVDSLWEQLWSASFRKELESMSASIREMVKARFYRNLEALRQPDGIHAVYRALFALASK